MNAATSTQVFSNTATDGGGLYIQTGSALITYTFFASNTATRGGGLYNSGGLVAAQIVSATHNRADDGGGFYNAAGGGLTLVNALVYSNASHQWRWIIQPVGSARCTPRYLLCQ